MVAFGSIVSEFNLGGVGSKLRVVRDDEACLEAAGLSDLDYISRVNARKRLAELLSLLKGRLLND